MQLDVETLELARKVFAESVPEQLRHPAIGIILGTGMAKVGQGIEDSVRVPYEQLPGFSQTTIAGHCGELLVGCIDGHPVVALNGRSHFYEGQSVEQIRYPVRFLESIGVQTLVIGNASGGINPRFRSGEVMIIDDHLDLMFRKPTTGVGEFSSTKHGRESKNSGALDRLLVQTIREPYSNHLNEKLESIGRKKNLPLHRGIYAAMTGPNYETRAEYRMLKKLGADVVGMSTIPEARVGVELGLDICGLSTITNIAKPDLLQSTSHEEVIEAVSRAEATLTVLISELVREIAG